MMRAVLELLGAIRGEIGELSLSGPRFRQANIAALAVGLAILLALALQLADPWWAGISAFMCTQASQPQSLQKGILRIAGTLVGAATAFILTPWLAYNPVATMIMLFVAGTLAILGGLLSPHGYAWLLGGITTIMVTLGALDDPMQALPIAFYRAAEIILGTATALLMTRLLAPHDGGGGATAPGWRSLLDANWHALSHALRTGVVIAAVPLVWRELELPNLSQMAISIGAVMAIPSLSGISDQDQKAISQRMLHRAAGCALGGCAGAILLALSISQSFVPWLLMIMAGTWVAMQIQNGRHGISGVGAQAAVAIILTLVQGAGPAATLLPAIERVAGMLGAIGLLLLINLLLGPPVAAQSLLDDRHGRGPSC
ncbi:FUSC family protein [Rhizobium sp. Root1220]|uniref:FUSC family protein n=1 Tax=Rhizobium sp. Root1220 TaxID=1736432 RepID=UPI0006F55F46|nr:FUSC family protein [Rhizobium sp. Root1220]KQV68411.1 hypothetical protein ASC90_12435 [Rhizobium sp. Root1220]